MKLIFRETLTSDVEGLFSVRARTRENPISKEQLESLGITAESIAKQMTSGRMKGWVCLDSSTLVGFCSGDAETGEVLVLAVLPDYERKGIGTYLLSRVVEWLRSVGSNTIWLAASPDPRTRAHGFYRSLGWRPNGEIDENDDEILELESGKPLRSGAPGMEKLSTDTLTGGCLCGAVRYRTGPPMLPATICHCRSCRLAAGANAVGLYTVEKATVAFTHGRPVEYRSSPKVLRGFCGRCGTALTYWEADWPTEFSLTIASLDNPGLVVPVDHTWMAHAVSGDSPTDRLPQHPTDRP